MNAALAGRMAVWTILIATGYALLCLAVAQLMGWLSKKYPRVMVTREEYYGVEPYTEDDDAEAFHLDSPQEPPTKPRAA